MSGSIEIGGHKVGLGLPTFVIAEVGVNHNGDLDLAHKLIDVAAEAGADPVKFQTFTPELLAAGHAPKAEDPAALPPRRQETQPAYELNGTVYVCPVPAFLRTARLVDDATAAYVMPVNRSIDIDSLEEFRAAEAAFAASPATDAGHG